MKKILWIVGLVIALCSPAFAKTIVAAADPWPPFVDPANPTDGLSLEIVRAAYKTQGYDVKMVYVPWARAEAGVKDGTYDILPNTWHTDARAKELLYSKAYAVNAVKFIKRKGDTFEYKGLDSLKGKRVGTVRGYGYGDAFLQSTAFSRDEVADVITNVKKLVSERIDLTLEDEIVATSMVAKEDIKLLDQIEFSKEALSSNSLFVTAGLKNPNHKAIIDAFNTGYDTIKSNGTLAGILKKYNLSK